MFSPLAKRPPLAARLDALIDKEGPSESMPTNKSRPILRWLTSHSPASSSPPSPDLRSLSEAIAEPLTPPPPARLPPPSFRPLQNLSRPTPFLVDSLTRSTLPTSSLSPPLPLVSSPCNPESITQTPRDVQKPPPLVLNQSSLTKTSVDSLRMLQTRSISGASIASLATAVHAVESPEAVQEISNNAPTSSSTANSWWWFQSESTTKERMLESSDQLAAQQEPDEQGSLQQKYKSTDNPVVFCHGLLGFDSVKIGPAIAPFEVTHWRGIKEVLEANGTEVLITRVPATSSPVDRAKVLRDRIDAVYPGRSVHLIGHSMGGLDSRYLTTHLTDRKFKVLSVTTIATPHRGSAFADHFLQAVGKTRLPQVLSLLDLLPNGGGDGAAFEFLTLESMKKFNEETPDVPGVKYFSWGAVYEPGLIDTWKYPHSVLLEKEGPNDGLVSIESAKWGTYLGTLNHVNHLDLVGWINEARYKWAEIMGKEIKFRPATFYMGIVDMLAKNVEGQADHDHAKAENPLASEAKQDGENLAKKASTSSTEQQQREQHVKGQMVESLNIAGGDVKEAGEGISKDDGQTPKG